MGAPKPATRVLSRGHIENRDTQGGEGHAKLVIELAAGLPRAEECHYFPEAGRTRQDSFLRPQGEWGSADALILYFLALEL